jgi:hypothetical protein
VSQLAHYAPGALAADELPPPTPEAWGEVYEACLAEDPCLFARDVLGLEIGPHMLAWGDMVQGSRRVAAMAARDHSKSTFFSYAYPIWRAWGDPGCEVYLFSATLEQAIEFLDIILYGRGNLRGMVDIPELAHLVPTKEDTYHNPRLRLMRSDARLKNGSRIRAVGYGKKIRGRHPRYIVCDDVLNDEDMYSETVRRKHIDYYKSAITNMITPDGQICCVGTPYHAADLWKFLKDNPKYTFRRFPGLYTDRHGNERALFPWRYSVEALRSKKVEIGPVAFTREILCQPISDDLSIFPSYVFPPLRDERISLRPTRAQIAARGLTCYAGVDIAISANVAADYFCVFVVGVDPLGNHHIVDIFRAKGMQFRQQLDVIERMCRRYDVQLCHIEANQMQRVWSDEMVRTTDVPVRPFVTLATNKYPLDRGLPGLRILTDNEKVVIPYAQDGYTREAVGIWEAECSAFGFVDGKLQGAGEHDDTVMAWWMAEEAAKLGGFAFAFGDEEGDAEAEAELLGEAPGDHEDWEAVMLGDADEDEMIGFDDDADRAEDEALGAYSLTG